MSANVFPQWPSFTQEEADAVSSVLLSNKVNYWTGDKCSAFESAYSEWAGVKHSIAVSNGTLALELALKGLGIGPGDDVIVTPRTFIASISSVVAVGATPIFADVDLETQSLNAQTISEVLTKNTKAVIVVHLAGIPADMDPIMELATTEGFSVIEDCAQAHGAMYKGRSVGSIGHIGAWSFCQDKIITTGGEGGMVTTNDSGLWEKMWSYKDHGKSYDQVFLRKHPPGFRWLHDSFGSNYRMTEMQAAIGLIQLRQIENWSATRRSNAAAIDAVADQYEFVRYSRPSFDYVGAEYKHYLFVEPELLKQGWTRDRIVEELNAKGVPCFQGGCSEVYLESAFDGTGWRPKERLPNAKKLGETSLMLLVHPTITEENMRSVQVELDKILSAC